MSDIERWSVSRNMVAVVPPEGPDAETRAWAEQNHGVEVVEYRRIQEAVSVLRKIVNGEHADDCGGMFDEPEGCYRKMAQDALDAIGGNS